MEKMLGMTIQEIMRASRQAQKRNSNKFTFIQERKIMRTGKALTLIILFSLAMHLIAQDNTQNQKAEVQLTEAEKIFGLSMLWQEAKYSFVFFDQVPDLDWDATYRKYIPKVLSTQSTLDYYLTLIRFYALLKDGHTDIYLPQSLRKELDHPPLYLDEIEGRAIVRAVDKAIEDKIPTGSEIIKVDGVEVKEYLINKVFPYISSSTDHILWRFGIIGNEVKGYGLLVGPVNSSVLVTAKTPEGQINEAELIRDRSSVKREWTSTFKRRDIVEWEKLDDGIIYVSLNSFSDQKVVTEFEKLLPELYSAAGIIMDLRFNGGGGDDKVKAILKYFTDKPYQRFKLKTREHRGAYKAWGKFSPDDEEVGPYYKGDAWYEIPISAVEPTEGKKIKVPMVILVSNYTASAAEDLLIFVDKWEQVTLVGQPSFGSTGQPIRIDLPGGGTARVCSLRCTYPDGREFVGYGVQPDIFVEPTVQALLDGIDLVLEKGLEILKAKLNVKN